MNDLQKWVERGEISTFGSDWVKYPRAAHDTYMKRQDAVRYCLESGFEVASPETAADDKASAPSAQEPTKPSAAERPQQAVLPNKENADSAPRMQKEERHDIAADAPAGTMLRPKEVMARTGLARSTFYERQNSKSKYFDPTFPQPRSLGESSVGYLEAEINQWIAARPAARR